MKCLLFAHYALAITECSKDVQMHKVTTDPMTARVTKEMGEGQIRDGMGAWFRLIVPG